ncbi:hypothetical protein [Mucilaginibacter sp. CSA2-8R]|uniref:hypothetical protein n=1 Tax=Mucilaginibacter sp. CSA2-8R TaxID=3141542 RepID=UPI00315C5635
MHLKKNFKATVFESDYPGGFTMFKLKLSDTKYWLLKAGENWKVLGDVTLNANLKNLIVAELEKTQSMQSTAA